MNPQVSAMLRELSVVSDRDHIEMRVVSDRSYIPGKKMEGTAVNVHTFAALKLFSITGLLQPLSRV